MKKISVLSILTASFLLLAACGEDTTEKTTDVKTEVKETVTHAKATDEIALNEVKEATVEKIKETKATTSTAAVNLTVCFSCHGGDFGLKALGASKIVKDMTKADIIASLKGYKDGSYGGNMKAIMLPQVATLGTADIEAIADLIVGN